MVLLAGKPGSQELEGEEEFRIISFALSHKTNKKSEEPLLIGLVSILFFF